MTPGNGLIQFSIHRPRLVAAFMALAALVLGALIVNVHVDTDPENMLSRDEAVRIFHNQNKKEFTLYDMVVLGIVNEKDPDGVFNPATLSRVQELTEYAGTLTWPDPEDPAKSMGVVKRDIIAPGNVDNIEQAGPGQVRFEWLMQEAPETREEALRIRDNAMANPMLNGTLVSEDGKALCLYLPITDKDLAHRIQAELKEKIASFTGDEQYHITGLPVAEDTFGVEMFIQMAISAPLAMLFIFLLMLFFFRKLTLIIPPMIIAMVSVICTMGLLIGTGNTVHIMSSMIPIFLMPVAVVDSIHILSEFYDQYQKTRDRRVTLEHVMAQLFRPMLYTSLTSATGFASLALTPIPPVRVFGIFVAVGIMLAWLFTITFIPAFVMMLKEESLANLGLAAGKTGGRGSLIAGHLRWLGGMTYRRAKTIITLSLAALVIAGYGITRIQINDNPVNWFTPNHPIRVADRMLNSHFGGTYEAFLVIEAAAAAEEGAVDIAPLLRDGLANLEASSPRQEEIISRAYADVDAHNGTTSASALLAALEKQWQQRQDAAVNDTDYDTWSNILDLLEEVRGRGQIFKQPAMLRYVEALQNHMLTTGIVGKSNSVVDIVKKVHQELFGGNPVYSRVPDSSAAAAQTLITYQNSHKPDDLFHFVTPDYRKANIWIQLKSGDNKDMEQVVRSAEDFFVQNPPPLPVMHNWAGLTYLNVVWQDKMVAGMLKAFMGSFAIVFLMMTFLFRSPLWGGVAMVPLTVTIALIYGIVGLVGKDYDMPIAVLSSLTLGLAVDFAIHFLQRSRTAYGKAGNWPETAKAMFEEPARAITRNIIVIAVGFTPLLAAPLMPYKTVGFFLASIMAVSGLGTMFIIPALITVLETKMFKRTP
ncbi:MAG: MMPL family transporter [Desulfobulbaceae bacterium]|nr:MMPL family transporter [Desulfobulbaceae bacterium]